MECEVGRELFEAYKDLVIQVQSHSLLVYALLAVTDKDSLKKVKTILEAHSASGEYQGVIAAALLDAQRTFAVLCDSDDPIDLRKLFQLIPGGKKDL